MLFVLKKFGTQQLISNKIEIICAHKRWKEKNRNFRIIRSLSENVIKFYMGN